MKEGDIYQYLVQCLSKEVLNLNLLKEKEVLC